MTHKTIKLIIVLLILIALYFVFLHRAPVQKTVKVLAIDSLQVSKISISYEIDTLRIAKINQRWVVDNEDQYSINPKKIEDFFQHVISMKRSTKLLTKDFKKHSRYNVLKELGINIILRDDQGSIIGDFIVGNGDFSSFSSLRFSDSNEVYELDSNISQYIFPNLSMWIDPVILHFKKEDLNSVKIESQRHQYTLKLENKKWMFHNNNEHFEVFTVNRSLFKILNILSNLQSTYILKSDSDEIVSRDMKKIADIQLGFTDQSKQTISVFTFDEENCAISINDSSRYYILNYDFINRFTKSPENFKDYSDQTY